MNTHPTPEQWMSHLYGEASPEQQAEFEAHRRSCAACRAQIQAWRQGMRELDAWSLPAPRAARWFPQPLLPWAAAAAIVLGVGVGIGRFSAAPDDAALQRAIQAEVTTRVDTARAEWTQQLDRQQRELVQVVRAAADAAASEETHELLARYTKLLEDQRESDHEAYVAAIHQLDERQRTDFSKLHAQLQTVALNADDSLNRTQEQLDRLQLASGTQPVLP